MGSLTESDNEPLAPFDYLTLFVIREAQEEHIMMGDNEFEGLTIPEITERINAMPRSRKFHILSRYYESWGL
jgi:hypothetical protein